MQIVLNHEAPVVEWFKTLVAKSRGRVFESHRVPKLSLQILFKFKILIKF